MVSPADSATAARHRWYRPTPGWLVIGLLVVEGLLLLSERFGWFTLSRHKGYAVLIAMAAAVAALASMLLWLVASVLLRRRFQFTLRTLLVLVVAVAIPSSWLAVELDRDKRQQRAVEEIERLGGEVLFDCRFEDPLSAIPHRRTLVRLRLLPPDGFFATPVAIVLPDSQGDSCLQHLEELTQLVDLRLSGTQITDAGLAYLKGLTRLERLNLSDTHVTDFGLEHLEGLTQLGDLDLSATQVTDSGLEHLKGLTRLATLSLSYTQVTDAGLEHLKGLTQLRALFLAGTQVTDEGEARLKQALPGCRIFR